MYIRRYCPDMAANDARRQKLWVEFKIDSPTRDIHVAQVPLCVHCVPHCLIDTFTKAPKVHTLLLMIISKTLRNLISITGTSTMHSGNSVGAYSR